MVTLTIAVALIASISATASAQALELVNSEGGELVKTKFTGEGGKTTLEITGEGSIICSKAATPGKFSGFKASMMTATFTGCEFAGLKCKTGSTAGEITTTVDGLLVYEVVGSELASAMLLTLPEEVTISCGSTQKLKVQGTVLASISPVGELVTSLKLSAKQSGGVPERTEYEEEEGGERKSTALKASGSGTKTFTNVQAGAEFGAALAFEEKVEATRLKLTAENIGGPPKAGTNKCEFALKFEPCTIKIQNHSVFPVKIIAAEITGAEAAARYKLTVETCTVGAKLKEEPPAPGGSCESKVEAIAEPAIGEKWVNNGFFVQVEAANGRRTAVQVLLSL